LRSMNAIARFNVRGDMAFSLCNFASWRQPAPQLALGESRGLRLYILLPCSSRISPLFARAIALARQGVASSLDYRLIDDSSECNFFGQPM
jgi:hypothetical protein